MSLEEHYGELMDQIISLMILLVAKYQDIMLQEQTYWLIVQ